MSNIRPELSPKNKYWIEKHRYYELKHFCLQYPIWKKIVANIDGLSKRPIIFQRGTNEQRSITEMAAINKAMYENKLRLVERVAELTDKELSTYILKGVTDGLPYEIVKMKYDIPCCREVYYELYRRFFWLLDKMREDNSLYNEVK